MHCNVSQWFVTHLQRFLWMLATLSNHEEWFSNVVQRIAAVFPNKMIANQGQCGTHNHSNMCFLQWYNALHTSRRSLWEGALRDDPKETTKLTSANWLDMISLRRSNGRLARMDRKSKVYLLSVLRDNTNKACTSNIGK